MADHYWVGGAADWDGIALLKWAATSGGVGGLSVPTAADNVFFDAASGSGTVTIAASVTCLNLDFTGFTGTLAGGNPLAISGNLSLSAAMTITYTSGITFNSTAAQTIASNGKALDGSITFNGVGGSWQLLDNLVNGQTRQTVLTNGTLDLNGHTLTTGQFASNNSNARTITTGTGGNIVITGNNTVVWSATTITNLTITGSLNVSFNYSGATGTRQIDHGGSAGGSEARAINCLITAGTDTLSITTAIGNLDFTGFSGTLSNVSRNIYGNLILSTGMTLSAGTSVTSFASTSSKTITSNGKAMDFPVSFTGTGGSWQLVDAMTLGSTRACTLGIGALNLNGQILTTGTFASSNSNVRTIAFGTGGSIVVQGSGATAFNTGTVTNLTITGTGAVSMVSASAKTFAGGGKSWPVTLNQGGAGALTVTGANSFANIDNTVNGTTVTLPASTTTTVTAFSLHGTAASQTTLQSSSSGTPATVSKASGAVITTGLNIKDIAFTGGASWRAPANLGNTDGGGDSGINFAPIGGAGHSGLHMGLGLSL